MPELIVADRLSKCVQHSVAMLGQRSCRLAQSLQAVEQCSTWNIRTSDMLRTCSSCRMVNRLCSASTSGKVPPSSAAEPACGGVSGPLGPRNRTTAPPGRTNACSVTQGPDFDPHRPQRQDIERLVQLRPRQQLLVAARLHVAVRRARATRIASRRNADFLAFTSTIVSDGRGSRPASSESRETRRRTRRPSTLARLDGRREMPDGQHRLEQQPVDRLVGIVERGQVDLAVPAGEQLVVGDQPVGELVGKEQAGLRRAARAGAS